MSTRINGHKRALWLGGKWPCHTKGKDQELPS